MLKKVYESLRNGAQKIKWFATLFSERMNIEIAIFKLLYQSDEMSKKRDELLKAIGERVVALQGHYEKNIFRDSEISAALEDIGKIEKNINDLKYKASEISRVTG